MVTERGTIVTRMACGAVIASSSYSIVVTAILILISVPYSQKGHQIIRNCENGKENQAMNTQSHIDFLNVDISSNDQDCNCEECSTLKYLGLEIFEIICLSLLWVGMVYLGYILTIHCKTMFSKWKKERAKADEKKFERLRIRFETKSNRKSDDGDSTSTQSKKSPAKFSYEKDDE